MREVIRLRCRNDRISVRVFEHKVEVDVRGDNTASDLIVVLSLHRNPAPRAVWSRKRSGLTTNRELLSVQVHELGNDVFAAFLNERVHADNIIRANRGRVEERASATECTTATRSGYADEIFGEVLRHRARCVFVLTVVDDDVEQIPAEVTHADVLSALDLSREKNGILSVEHRELSLERGVLFEDCPRLRGDQKVFGLSAVSDKLGDHLNHVFVRSRAFATPCVLRDIALVVSLCITVIIHVNLDWRAVRCTCGHRTRYAIVEEHLSTSLLD